MRGPGNTHALQSRVTCYTLKKNFDLISSGFTTFVILFSKHSFTNKSEQKHIKHIKMSLVVYFSIGTLTTV